MRLLKWLLSIANVRRTFATGIAGFSHVVDSLSAIKYAKVKAIRDEDGITTDFEIEGDFQDTETMMTELMRSQYGFLRTFMEKVASNMRTYRRFRAYNIYSYNYI